MLKMTHINSKSADQVASMIIELLEPWIPFIHTTTSNIHKAIVKQLVIDFFFAKLSHSKQKGLNENLNGLVRQYFP